MFEHPLLPVHGAGSKQQSIIRDERHERITRVLLLSHLRKRLLSLHHLLQRRLSVRNRSNGQNQRRNHDSHAHNPSPIRLNPRPLWQPATHFPESTHQCSELWRVVHDSSLPIDHTSQTTQANMNSPSTPLYSPQHKRRSFRKPVLCCRCRFLELVHRATTRPHPDAADAQRSLSVDYHPITIQRPAALPEF